MEVNNSASSSSTGTKSKIQPLGTFQEENHNWDDFRSNSFEDSFFDPHASVLNRLENEDVEDTSTSVGYLKHIYFKVVDPELIEYFTQYDSGDGFVTNTKDFSYIRKDGQLYRRKLLSPVVKPKVDEKLDFIIKPSKLSKDYDASKLGENLPPLKIKPPPGWTNSVYSDITEGLKKSEDEVEYIEAKSLNRHPKKKDHYDTELKMLNSEDLDKLEREVNELKRPLFDKLKEKYINNTTTFKVSNSQYVISKQVFDLESKRPDKERDNEVIAAHLSLKSSIVDQRTRLKELEKELVQLSQRKSPYYVAEIHMPKFGPNDRFDAEDIKVFPVVATDQDISIKDLFELLSGWAEDIGLSEKGLKRAMFSRLRGERAKAWLSYYKQPIKEAITSLSLLYDKNDSPLKYGNEIKNFTKNPNEDIHNSVQRLIRSIDKYLENRPDHDKKVLRMEYIKEKLDKLLSPRALREVFRMIEEKHQLGEDVSERELLTFIYKEDMFDKRTEGNQSYIRLQNINYDSNCETSCEGADVTDTDDIDSLCDSIYGLELNAAEHKRPFDDSLENTRSNFKQARTDRKILHPVKKIGGNNPIVIGNQGTPLVRIGNPNPNNRWHNRSSQNPTSNDKFNQSRNLPYNPNQFRNLYSRNAPLQNYQSNFRPQMKYNRSNDFDRFQTNGYNGSYNSRNGYNNSYNDRNRGYRSNHQFNQNRNGYDPNRSNLKHNMQVRTNPPSIFQQITLNELNAICAECPKEDEQHKVANCPNVKVFRQGMRPQNRT